MSHSYVGILDGWRPTLRGQPGQNYIVGTSQLPTLSFNVAVTNMPPRVLLLGGHGRVSLLLTPMLLSRSWSVTSVIRDPSQTEEILSKGKGQTRKGRCSSPQSGRHQERRTSPERPRRSEASICRLVRRYASLPLLTAPTCTLISTRRWW